MHHSIPIGRPSCIAQLVAVINVSVCVFIRAEEAEFVSEEQYNWILRVSTVCALCKDPFKTGDKKVLDHDHKTGNLRGVIHGRCNVAIGLLGDNREGILRALNYLSV